MISRVPCNKSSQTLNASLILMNLNINNKYSHNQYILLISAPLLQTNMFNMMFLFMFTLTLTFLFIDVHHALSLLLSLLVYCLFIYVETCTSCLPPKYHVFSLSFFRLLPNNIQICYHFSLVIFVVNNISIATCFIPSSDNIDVQMLMLYWLWPSQQVSIIAWTYFIKIGSSSLIFSINLFSQLFIFLKRLRTYIESGSSFHISYNYEREEVLQAARDSQGSRSSRRKQLRHQQPLPLLWRFNSDIQPQK